MSGHVRPKAAVIGWPAAHSHSPAVHGYWLKQYGIEGEYGVLETPPEDLERTLHSLGRSGYRGANLTLPHKEAALGLVDALDESARTVGAVNTVHVQKDGCLKGYNSDVYGFAENLKQQPGFAALTKECALVLGAGGAARAVVAALRQLGFGRIILANRTQEKAQELAGDFNAQAVAWDKKDDALASVSLLVNATALGMKGKERLDISLEQLPRASWVADIVYTPLQTDLLKRAAERGNPAIDGLGMLLHQARLGFGLWFGREPEVTADLRRFVLEKMA